MKDCLFIDGPADRVRKVEPSAARVIAFATFEGQIMENADQLPDEPQILPIRHAVYRFAGETPAGTALYVFEHYR